MNPDHPRPVAVYGTLRPGQGRSAAWEDLAVASGDGNIVIPDHRLVTHGSFPYALPAPGEDSIGCLVYADPGRQAEMLARFDAIEGVPSHYQRCLVLVRNQDGDMLSAWLYVPARPLEYEHLAPVRLNDWSKAHLKVVP